MTLALEWSQQEEFRSKPLNVWSVANGDVSGLVRSGGGLTYATIAGAGHMVSGDYLPDGHEDRSSSIALQAPFDKPVESLELANRWLANEEI